MIESSDETMKIRTRMPQFTPTEQIKFFQSLKHAKFSGQLIISDAQNTSWIIYLYLGRIIFATGGIHSVRRWRRNLVAYCPNRVQHFHDTRSEFKTMATQEGRISWEYKLLSIWIDEGKITLEQATQIIKSSIVEVLFDILQAVDILCETIKDNLLSTRLPLVESDKAVAAAYKLWQKWSKAELTSYSPNMAPTIHQPEALERKTSPALYKNLTHLLDGQQSLRDLGIRMKREPISITRSLLPFIQSGLIQLVKINDIPPPISTPLFQKLFNKAVPKKVKIACVDDSPAICQTMEKIITSAGYQFIKEMDGLRAIASLLSSRPDLIFLDLILPNTNGYEICTQLRKLSYFRNTPIIIVTGNDGIVDRVRAKMVGSTDFISKPVDTTTVINAIDKHLSHKV